MTVDVNDTDLINKLAFVDDRERWLFAKVQLGEQIREFLNTPVGKYLHERARMERDECMEKAIMCDADWLFGRKKLKKLQRRSDAVQNFMAWLADGLIEAEHAEHELSEYRG